MKHKYSNPKSKVQEQQPTKVYSVKPDGIKTVGWPDPKHPDLYFFKHENELRWVNLSFLKSHCLRKSREVKCLNVAEDFSQWACLANIERINNGNTKNGHLNNVNWLWNEFIDREYGVKSPMGKRAQAYKNTISYDVALNEDGGTLLDILTDDKNPSPAEVIEAKEAVKEKLILIKAENDERKKVVPVKNYNQSFVAVENRVYRFLLEQSAYRGFGPMNLNTLAQECGMELKEFKLAIGRLDRKAKLLIKNYFYFLPDELFTDEVA